MLITTAIRIAALVIAPVLFSSNIDRHYSERPRIMVLEPQTATPGDIVSAHGMNLERSRVGELILENGERRAMTHIVEQRPDLIRFRVPRAIDPGDYTVKLVVDTRWGTELADQEVVLTVVGWYRSGL